MRDTASALPTVVRLCPPVLTQDDLRWLLDKEAKGGSLKAAAAELEAAELAEKEETVAQLRIELGRLRNGTLRRTTKLGILEKERKLLQEAAEDTPAEVREAAERVAKHEATLEQAVQMEVLADEQCDYALTLTMLVNRLTKAKAGTSDALQALRTQAAEYDLLTKRQAAANKPIVHAAWQARNGATLQEQLYAGQRRTRTMLEGKRKGCLVTAQRDVANLSAQVLCS